MQNPGENPVHVWTWRVGFDPEFEARLDLTLLQAITQGQGQWHPRAPELSSFSRNRLHNLMDQGMVTIDGSALSSRRDARILKQGSIVEIRFPALQPLRAISQAIALNFLYDDPHLLIVNKPQGLTVHPSETQVDGTLVNALLSYTERGLISGLSGIGGVLRPGIVHRLDKNTSGALVVSKTDSAHHHLTETFSAHAIERTYLALAYSAPKEDFVSIKETIGRNPADRKKMAAGVPHGKSAHTDVRVLARYSQHNDRQKCFASLLALTLHTGRTHQIRVHLTSLQCSVLGDPVYGQPTSQQGKWLALPPEIRAAVTALPGQALHAQVLGFQHPREGFFLRTEALPPENFSKLRELLSPYQLR